MSKLKNYGDKTSPCLNHEQETPHTKYFRVQNLLYLSFKYNFISPAILMGI